MSEKIVTVRREGDASTRVGIYGAPVWYLNCKEQRMGLEGVDIPMREKKEGKDLKKMISNRKRAENARGPIIIRVQIKRRNGQIIASVFLLR